MTMERIPDRGDLVDFDVNIHFANGGIAEHGTVTVNNEKTGHSFRFTFTGWTDLRAQLAQRLGLSAQEAEGMLIDAEIFPRRH